MTVLTPLQCPIGITIFNIGIYNGERRCYVECINKVEHLRAFEEGGEGMGEEAEGGEGSGSSSSSRGKDLFGGGPRKFVYSEEVVTMENA